jgi:hypothetical protein
MADLFFIFASVSQTIPRARKALAIFAVRFFTVVSTVGEFLAAKPRNSAQGAANPFR